MNQPLTFEEWKEKYFNNSPEFRDQVMNSGGFTEDQVNELLSNAMETQYNAYKSYYAPFQTV
jgi:hypothetical protein